MERKGHRLVIAKAMVERPQWSLPNGVVAAHPHAKKLPPHGKYVWIGFLSHVPPDLLPGGTGLLSQPGRF
jgi:hypothetical protein